jgi:hypothetical protein
MAKEGIYIFHSITVCQVSLPVIGTSLEIVNSWLKLYDQVVQIWLLARMTAYHCDANVAIAYRKTAVSREPCPCIPIPCVLAELHGSKMP